MSIKALIRRFRPSLRTRVTEGRGIPANPVDESLMRRIEENRERLRARGVVPKSIRSGGPDSAA